MKRFALRLAPIVAVVAWIAGCDTRRLTSSSNQFADTQSPIIDVTVAGDPTQPVDIGLPLAVTVTAADNLSLLRIELTVTNGATLVSRDTVRFSQQTPSYQNTFSVSLAGVDAGDVLTLRGIALDGAGNIGIDSLQVTVVDTSAPVIAISSPAAGSIFKTGNTMRVTLSATDNARLDYLGFEIVSQTTTGGTTTFFRDSAIFAVKPTRKDTSFTFIIPASMPPQAFQVRGFANDLSGNRGFSAFVDFTVRDTIAPTLIWIAPPESALFNPADSFVVTTRIIDSVGLARLTLVGIALRGDPFFGVVDTIIRYDSTFAPINVAGEARTFPPGTIDVTVSRYLKPVDPRDTITEPIKIVGTVTDVSGNVTTSVRTIILVSGPRVFVLRPGASSQTSAGKIVIVELRATDIDGVTQIGYRVPELGLTRTRNISNNPRDTSWTDTLLVPLGTPAGTRLNITPFAFDRGGQPGSGPIVQVLVLAPAADTQGPLVFQTVPDRLEIDDTVQVRAVDPSGVSSVGYWIKDSLGVTIDSQQVARSGQSGDELVFFQLAIPAVYQGGRLQITSYARDALGNLGYSGTLTDTVPRTAAQAVTDTLDVVYGRTYPLPSGGLGADIAVDTVPGRERAFVSNITFDRLEIWESSTNIFNSRTIPVGADPWGMFVDGDTLLVANSAGTNISRVDIQAAAVGGVNELLGRRIKTPLSIAHDITRFVDETGIHWSVQRFQFSDRPQYVAQMRRQGNAGDIFYTTKPTVEAPEGTIRRYDVVFNESQQIWQYGRKRVNPTGGVAVFNADSVFVIVQGDSLGDKLFICDHPYGDQNPANAYCVGGMNVYSIIYGDSTGGPYLRDATRRSDVVGISELLIPSLALTDTTFLAAGGDRRWVVFGEANTQVNVPGRVMLAKDTLVQDSVTNSLINFFSPSVFVSDLTNQADERISGVTLNSNSTVVGVHGRNESFFAEVGHPFLLRMQGKSSTISEGAGIAFHPDNDNSTATDGAPQHTAFVASRSGVIEIIDTHHYLKRGELPVRASLYGPIRVTHRFSTDPPEVVLKLFGLTTEGFIVIDIRATDIRPLP